MNDLLEDIQDGVLLDDELEAAAPVAVAELRRDPMLAGKIFSEKRA